VTPVVGIIDLIVSRNEQDYLVDLKWAFSSKRYEEKLRTGNDLQLVLYQSLYPSAVTSGYFLFNDGKLHMRREPGCPQVKQANYVQATPDVSVLKIFNQAQNSLSYRLDELKGGKAETGYSTMVNDLNYYNDSTSRNLYPLEMVDEEYKRPPYANDLNLFFGNVH
jgi:hypothetical protein